MVGHVSSFLSEFEWAAKINWSIPAPQNEEKIYKQKKHEDSKQYNLSMKNNL